MTSVEKLQCNINSYNTWSNPVMMRGVLHIRPSVLEVIHKQKTGMGIEVDSWTMQRERQVLKHKYLNS